MSEMQPPVETEQDRLRTAYDIFVRLAEDYGKCSKDGGSTFFREMPTSPGRKDKISGRYFGDKVRKVDIFFRKDANAGQITLVRNELGEVSLERADLFWHVETTNEDGSPGRPELVPNPDATFDPKVVIDLLRNAEKICIQQRHIQEEKLPAAKKFGVAHARDLRIEEERRKRAELRREEELIEQRRKINGNHNNHEHK